MANLYIQYCYIMLSSILLVNVLQHLNKEKPSTWQLRGAEMLLNQN